MWYVIVSVTWRFRGNHILTDIFFFKMSYFKIKQKLSCSIFKSLDHSMVFFIRFDYFWADFGRFFWGFGKIQKSKMADLDDRLSGMMT